MNDKIDINDLEWVVGVADDLDEIADELKEVNKLLKELDDCLEDNNLKREIYFGFVDQSRDLDKIKDNVQIIRRAAKSPATSYGYKSDMSIASLVDLCIDQPFHKKMEKTVARLAKADISNYTAENSGGIVVEEETWEAGASINSPSTRVVKLVTPKRLTINDILSSPFSKAMRKKQYQEYLKLLYPDLSDKSIGEIDTKLLYDMYLKSQLDMADFDYLTQIEEGLDGLRKIGLGLGLATIAIVLSPATAALLGAGAAVITVSSAAVNGFLSIVDVVSLISGKDINGNELTKAERENLLASVVIDGTFLAGSIYSKIQLNNISKASDDVITQVKNGDIILQTSKQKGNFGEMVMDDYYKNLGYERVSLNQVSSLDDTIKKGIDGVYYNPSGKPPYIIGEAKYGSSQLSMLTDGKQMSDNWIFGSNRIETSIGKDVVDDMLIDGFSRQLVNVDASGNTTVKILDKNGNIIRNK